MNVLGAARQAVRAVTSGKASQAEFASGLAADFRARSAGDADALRRAGMEAAGLSGGQAFSFRNNVHLVADGWRVLSPLGHSGGAPSLDIAGRWAQDAMRNGARGAVIVAPDGHRIVIGGGYGT